MKVQVRRGVFETNSSATHSLTLYEKSEWEKFKNGEDLIDEGWYSDKSPKYQTKDDIRNSKQFQSWLKNNYAEEDLKQMNKDELDEVLTEFMDEEYIWDYDSYTEYYEVLEEEVPNSNYVAVSIYRGDW